MEQKRPRHVRGLFSRTSGELHALSVFHLCTMSDPTSTDSPCLAAQRLGRACPCRGHVGLDGLESAWLGIQLRLRAVLPADHPETTFYREFRETFGSDNDFLIVGFEGDSLTASFWRRSMPKWTPYAPFLGRNGAVPHPPQASRS